MGGTVSASRWNWGQCRHHHPSHDVDVTYAAERITWGGFSYAGRPGISVQWMFVHEDSYQPFLEALLPRVRALKVDDSLDEAMDVGPVINGGEAERVATCLLSM